MKYNALLQSQKIIYGAVYFTIAIIQKSFFKKLQKMHQYTNGYFYFNNNSFREIKFLTLKKNHHHHLIICNFVFYVKNASHIGSTTVIN